MNLALADETALLSRAVHDPQAAEQLIRAQMPRIYAVCLSIVHDPEVAAELSQDAVLRLYRSLPGFRGDCTWSTWAWRVARNLSLNWRAKMRERSGDESWELHDEGPLASEALAQRERDAGVRKALQGLAEEERQALILHYEQGLSMEEVTVRLGLHNRSGARGVLQRARRKLRREAMMGMPEDSVVLRAGEAERAREAMEETLTRVLRGEESGREPRVREMGRRRSLVD